jgi:serine/threonine/tyrosine-interacting protein
MTDWRYEMRREAQEILPGLFVGGYQPSRDLELLNRLGITSIVCVSEDREKHLVKPRFIGKFEYMNLEMRDATDQNLIRLFPQ